MFRDDDREVDIVWYPCAPGAPALAVPSVICSLDWWVQERTLGIYAGYDVGEVPGATRLYNGEGVKPNATGLHRCGTEDEWFNGAKFDPTVNRPKRADGLPTCCGEMPAGVVVGGAGIQPQTGGVVIGGQSFGYLLGGTTCDIAPTWNVSVLGNAFYVDDFFGPGHTWIRVNGLTVGDTYRFDVLLRDANADIHFFGGLNCFFGQTFVQDVGPGAESYSLTQTIPAGTVAVFFNVRNLVTGLASFFVTVTHL